MKWLLAVVAFLVLDVTAQGYAESSTLAVLDQADTREAIEQQGMQPAPLAARDFEAFFNDELTGYGELVRRFGIPTE